MNLVEKKIVLISPERWGTSRLSKHHYAVALCERGNQVYFINPPSKGQREVRLAQTDIAGLTIVDYSQTIRGLNSILWAFPRLFDFLCAIDIRKILRKLSVQPDVVWNFDPFRFQHLKLFRAPIAIFHPVDYFKSKLDITTARHADIIFSVAQPILNRYSSVVTPAFLINHGLSPAYLHQKRGKKKDHLIRCGYVGNLLSFGIHWKNLMEIAADNRNVQFHFIGPISDSNLGATKNVQNDLTQLQNEENCIFYGELPPAKVAEAIQSFDLFLICYDPEGVGDVVSNSHKILEYLSTGKVVVSSRMSTYSQLADGLFEMVSDSTLLPKKFKEVVQNIALYNAEEKQLTRIAFAAKNSYENHLQTIEKLVTEHVEHNLPHDPV